MNRRSFLALSGLAGIAPGPFSRVLLAERTDPAPQRSRLKLPLLKQLLSTPQIGFPTLTPTFGAMFAPGAGPAHLIRSETFDDFTAQVQTQSTIGYVLSAMTTIQNLNRTWFFGAFQPGSGAFQLLRTSDPSAFQQSFTQFQSAYTLIDFNVAWELGTIYYTGYWLANSVNANPAGQMLLWDQDLNTLTTKANTFGSQGLVMTRVQAYPQNDATLFSALFNPGKDSFIFYYDGPAPSFAVDVVNFQSNSLAGLTFDPVQGYLAGCWRDKVAPTQFVINQDWATLNVTAQKASAKGMVLTAMAAYPNAPDFDDFFETNLAPLVEGYGYAVALNGQVIASGGGFARSAYEQTNPSTPFTADTRINLAGVSKAITGIALQVLMAQTGLSLDAPFWPLIQSMVPKPDPSVTVVTLRNLATNMSGLMQEAGAGPLGPPSGSSDIWAWLNSYLAQKLEGIPGFTFYTDNTNFTILQAVISQVSGMDYVDYVTRYVLVPAGIDPAIFNATPDDRSIATLQYAGPNDATPGGYWGPLGFVAAGGWIASARELIKILIALRGNSLLAANPTTDLFYGNIGWDGSVAGTFGTYYTKNGRLSSGTQSLNTCMVRFAEGYDAVLLANSSAPVDVTSLCIDAFDSRGVYLSSEPSNGPSITSVVHGASFLANCAPGSYLSIIGAGYPGPALAWDPSTTLPTELNGVQVRVGSEYAYIAYAGPTQINFLLPSTAPAGLQNVELTMPGGGMVSSVQINAIAPGLFAYTLNGRSYPAALFAGTSVIVTASRPATGGDVVEFYGTGMGPTSPAAPDGIVFNNSYPAADLTAFNVTIGGKTATVSFAGLVSPGLFQLDVQIPTGLPGGDQPVTLTVGGIAAQSNLMLSIAG